MRYSACLVAIAALIAGFAVFFKFSKIAQFENVNWTASLQTQYENLKSMASCQTRTASSRTNLYAPPDRNLRMLVTEGTITTSNRTNTYVPPDGNSRVLMIEGCSGSSFVIRALKKILTLHGFVVKKWEKTEVYKPANNAMFDKAKELAPDDATEKEIVTNATLLLDQKASQEGRTTIYKWPNYDGYHKELVRQAGGRVLSAALSRQNHLDRVVCSIRDCFASLAKQVGGYPVFAVNGSESTACFDRRQKDVKTKAYIDPTKIVDVIISLEDRMDHKKKSFPGLTVSYEELVAFEYTDDEGVWENSFGAWSLLASVYIGNTTSFDAATLKDYLSPIRNSRNISYHKDVIQNYEEVFEAMRAAGKGEYIRAL